MVLDKRLLGRHFPSVSSFNFMVGVVQGIVGATTLAVALPVMGYEGTGIVIAYASGIIWAIGLSLFFFGLQREEVSRAAPIYGTYPLFTALWAAAFLSEQLTTVQWTAIVVTVLGAGLISINPQRRGRRGLMEPMALTVLVAGAAITGSAWVLNKQATLNTPFWLVFGSRALGMATGMAFLSYRPALRIHILQALRDPATRRLYIATEVALATLAVGMLQLAIFLGPVSLVSALNSTRSLFVLIITVLFAGIWKVLDETVDGGALTLKATAVALIVGGLVALAL